MSDIRSNEKFTELYEKHYESVYKVAYSIVKNEADACDLVQETYKTVWEKIDTLSDIEKFDKWVIQIVANKCKDFLRKKKPNVFSELANDEEEYDFDIEDTSEQFNPDAVLDNNETKKIIEEILYSLPENQRLCLILFYGKDMKISEIATALNISENTVKSRLNYGKKKMKQKVDELENNGTKLHGVSGIGIVSLIKQLFSSKEFAQPPVVLAPSGVIAKEIIKSAVAGGGKSGIPIISKMAAFFGEHLAVKITATVVATAIVATAGVAIIKPELFSKKEDVSSISESTDAGITDKNESSMPSEETSSELSSSSEEQISSQESTVPSSVTSSGNTSTEITLNYMMYVAGLNISVPDDVIAEEVEAETVVAEEVVAEDIVAETDALSEEVNSSASSTNSVLVYYDDASDFTKEDIETFYPNFATNDRFTDYEKFLVLDNGTQDKESVLKEPTAKTNISYDYAIFGKDLKGSVTTSCIFIIVSYDCDIDNNKRYDIYTTYYEKLGSNNDFEELVSKSPTGNEFTIVTNGHYPLTQTQIIESLDSYYSAQNYDFEYTVLK